MKQTLLALLTLSVVVSFALPATVGAVGEAEWGDHAMDPFASITGVAVLSDEVVVCTTPNGIYRTINGGGSWKEMWPEPADLILTDIWVYDVTFVNELEGWAVGRHRTNLIPTPRYKALILHTSDGGVTWTRQDDGLGTDEPRLNAIDALDSNWLVCVGEDGTQYRTNDGGENWGAYFGSASEDYNDVAWADQDHFLVVGDSGVIRRYVRNTGLDFFDYGETSAGLTTDDIDCVDFFPGTAKAEAYAGTTRFTTPDYGDNWTSSDVSSLGEYRTIDIDFLNSTTGWGVGALDLTSPVVEAAFYQMTTNGGSNWSYHTLHTDSDSPQYAVDALAAGEVWTGGYFGNMYHLATTTAERIAGATRYETAIEISEATFPFNSAHTVVIATGRNYPDALSASSLAGFVEGPLLLVGDTVTTALKNELARLGTKKAYVVGGEGAVSSAVVSALEVEGITVERVAGADRYATSVEVARLVADLKQHGFFINAYFARGDNFPDALAVSPLCYATQEPVLLVRPDSLPSVVAKAITDLQIQDGAVIGGQGAVSDAVKVEIENAMMFGSIERWAGADRYETAAIVAFKPWNHAGSFYGIATGANFPDALAGGIACGAMRGSLLLTRQSSLPQPTEDFILDNDRFDTDTRVFGGSSVVGDQVLNDIKALY